MVDKLMIVSEDKPTEKYDPNKHVMICKGCFAYLNIVRNKMKNGKWKCYHCGQTFDKISYRNRRPTGFHQTYHKKKPVRNADIMSEKEIRRKLEDYTKYIYLMKPYQIRYIGFVATMFLTGARCREIVGVRDPKDRKKYITEPLKREQIRFTTEYGIPILEFENLPVLKRYDPMIKKGSANDIGLNHYPTKTVSVIIEHYKEIVDYLQRYLNHPRSNRKYLFNMSQPTAWSICHEILGVNVHHLRHARTANLIDMYDFNDTQLQHFHNWASSAMAAKYSHIRKSDLIKSMIHNYNEKKQAMLTTVKNE